MDADDVRLEAASLDEAALLSNLLELYTHDLSDVFLNVELGADGRFGYEKLSTFWSDPTRRFPFLIRHGTRVAGFVLATRGSPATDDPDVFDVAEFFVVRRWRRSGVGRRAAHLLWDQLPGRWVVRVFERNAAAVPFWSRVIAEYSGREPAALDQLQHTDGWRVFCFDSARQTP